MGGKDDIGSYGKKTHIGRKFCKMEVDRDYSINASMYGMHFYIIACPPCQP